MYEKGVWEYDAGYQRKRSSSKRDRAGRRRQRCRREPRRGPRVTHLGWMTANVVLYACTELLLVDKEGWLLGKAMCVVRAVTSLSVGEVR